MAIDRGEALRATIAACLITLAAELAFARIDAVTLGAVPNSWLDVGHAALAGIFAVALWLRRRAVAVVTCEVTFLVVALAYLPVFWVGELTAAGLGLTRDPLVPHQLLMVGLALLAPGRLWLAAGLIGVVLLDTVALFAVLATRYPLAGVAGEPWITLVFGGVAAGFVLSRARLRIIMERLAAARAEADACGQATRVFLSVRDRANSPLQTLELGAVLLERRCPEQDRVVQPMRRAIARLRALSASLAEAEVAISQRADGVSPASAGSWRDARPRA